jgi:hypothetical protein
MKTRCEFLNQRGFLLPPGLLTDHSPFASPSVCVSSAGWLLRYGPHEDADPFKPRVPALIHHFVAYKNQDHGAWLRGGDVWLDECQ